MAEAFLQVALFPIPNVVAFPGTILPLHVFEPRYRAMVQESINLERMVAVCHTKKTIRSARKDQTPEQALKSNQATYEPHQIFSAGYCEIVEITKDGRLYANVKMSKRLKMEAEVQTIPYRIVDCSELLDLDEDISDADSLVSDITQQIVEIAAPRNPTVSNILSDERWTSLSAEQFSHKLFQFLKFDPDTMQHILETPSLITRLQTINECLRDILQSNS